MKGKLLRAPLPLGVLFPIITLLLSLTYVFFTILLYLADQMGKIYQTIRTHPRSTSWLLGLYIGTYIISCSLLLSGLEVTIRLDGVFLVIYLASAVANIISLLRVSNWVFARPERSDVLRHIEEVKALADLEN